jgi:predicted alpha/beta superfamily hydrolase
MKTSFIFAIFFVYIFFSGTINAQNQQNILHTIQSKVFGKEREIKVFLPERYFRDSTSKFITVYVLDAQDEQVWNMVKSNIDYLVSRYSIIPAIVIGIVSESRGKEFRPPSTNLINHFSEEVFSIIENNYRTMPLKVLIGHSLGGAFVGNTLFSEHSDLFNSYIAISPSLDINNKIIFKNADSILNSKKDFKKFFYFSSGNVGFESEFVHNVEQMDSLLTKYQPLNLSWKSNFFKGKDHFSALIPALNDGLLSLSRNYFVDQKIIEDFALNKSYSISKQLSSYYKLQEENFGFSFKPSDNYLKMVADDFNEKELYDLAVQIYQIVLENGANDVKLYFSLADAYDKKGDIDSAKKTFIKSLKLLEEQKEKVSEAYYRDILKWANQKLESYN